MTDEELRQTLEEIYRDIGELSAPGKPLLLAERNRRQLLLKKKDILEKIRQARETKNPGEEIRHITAYRLLCSYGEKHPFLLRYLQNRLRWHIF